jgi:hypothetical protein
MSTIIIITPPKKDPRRVVENNDGVEIVEGNQTIATFNGPDASENAIRYLKVMKG